MSPPNRLSRLAGLGLLTLLLSCGTGRTLAQAGNDNPVSTAADPAEARAEFLRTEAEIAAALAQAPAADDPEARMAWIDRFLVLNGPLLREHHKQPGATGSHSHPETHADPPDATLPEQHSAPAGSDIPAVPLDAAALAQAPPATDPEARMAWIDAFLKSRDARPNPVPAD